MKRFLVIVLMLAACGGTINLVIGNTDGGADVFNECVPTCTGPGASYPTGLHCATYSDGTWGRCGP